MTTPADYRNRPPTSARAKLVKYGKPHDIALQAVLYMDTIQAMAMHLNADGQVLLRAALRELTTELAKQSLQYQPPQL